MYAIAASALPLPPGVTPDPDPPPRPDGDPSEDAGTGRRSHVRARQGAFALLLYLSVSFLLYGLPILRHYATSFAGKAAGDSRIFLWSFAWWPHALSQGVSPVVSHAIFEPNGINLAWATSIPGPAIIMWPITKAFGPLVSMNLITMLAPALAAWGAYLICRRVSEKFWPAVLGGYLFGFSSYITEQLTGHVNLFLIFCVPLAAYLVIRRIDGSLPVGRFVLGLGLVLVLQFSISTEVFATLAFFGGVAMLGALVLARERRRAVAATAGWTVAAFALAGLILFPLLTFVVKGAPAGPIRPVVAGASSVDAASLLVPRHSTLIGGETFHRYSAQTIGSPAEQGAYIPLPLIAALITAAFVLRRDRITRLVLAFTGLALVFSLGTYLHFNGVKLIPMPWTPFAHIPILQDALPSRFTMYAWLGIAVIAARWMATTKRPLRRMAVVALSALMLLPNVASADVHLPLRVPVFFENGSFRRYIAQDHTILYIHPDKGGEMLAQIESHFWFRLAQGHTGPTPASFQREAGYHAIDTANASALTYLTLRAFIRDHNVSTVVVADGLAGQWGSVVGQATGVSAIVTGGVHVYQLGASSPVVPPSTTRPGTHHSRGNGHRRRTRPRSNATTAPAGHTGRPIRAG